MIVNIDRAYVFQDFDEGTCPYSRSEFRSRDKPANKRPRYPYPRVTHGRLHNGSANSCHRALSPRYVCNAIVRIVVASAWRNNKLLLETLLLETRVNVFLEQQPSAGSEEKFRKSERDWERKVEKNRDYH